MKTTQQTFIKVSKDVMRKTDISSTEKLTISYLLSFQQNNQVCFQTEEEISFELGMSLRTLKRTIKRLIEIGICYKEKASLHTGKRQYKNRKAIIVNLYPEETTIKKEPIVETQNGDVIVDVKVEDKTPEIKENDDVFKVKKEKSNTVKLSNGKKIIIEDEYLTKYFEKISKNKNRDVYLKLISCENQIDVFNILKYEIQNDFIFQIENDL